MRSNQTVIIAEAGVNHNGSIDLAKSMVKVAAEFGADMIKFQTFVSENLVSKGAQKAAYQAKNTRNNSSQLEMLRNLALEFEEFRELQKYCMECKISFLSTPFDDDSISFLDELNMPFWKIPSGEITNVPYLIQIAKTGKPIVMSTGMADMDEVEFAVKLLKEYGAGEISLLHCNTEYPTPYKDVNLKAMQTLKQRFNCRVGYSDHTQGIEVPIAAVAMGAEIIEKHFTLDRNMEGPDHKASLEPDEFAQMVTSVRNIEKALGNGEKNPSDSEKKNINIARKSLVAAKRIRQGEILTDENITTKRPGDGISAKHWFDVLGTKAIADFEIDEKIRT